jgi:glycosyltransferase involved in cell wall biosynthesis
VQVWLGTVRLLGGDVAGAREHAGRGLASARRRKDRLTSYVALFTLSQAAIVSGDHALAREHLQEGLRLTVETRDLANLAYFLEALAVVEAGTGSLARVPVLVGAAEGVRELVGGEVYGYYQPDPALLAGAVTASRAALGDDAYDDALDGGRALSADEALRLGLPA